MIKLTIIIIVVIIILIILIHNFFILQAKKRVNRLTINRSTPCLINIHPRNMMHTTLQSNHQIPTSRIQSILISEIFNQLAMLKQTFHLSLCNYIQKY